MTITKRKLVPTSWEVRRVRYAPPFYSSGDVPDAREAFLRAAGDAGVLLQEDGALGAGQWDAVVDMLDTQVSHQLFSALVASQENTLRIVSWTEEVTAIGPLAEQMSNRQRATVRQLVVSGTMWCGTFATAFAPSYRAQKHQGSRPPD
jgi:hypothetical protein